MPTQSDAKEGDIAVPCLHLAKIVSSLTRAGEAPTILRILFSVSINLVSGVKN